MVTIGVAIPCFKGHIGHLKNLLESIQQQTRIPDRVVVCCSSSEPQDIPYTQEMFSFPLQILVTPEKRSAAQNRNAAASQLQTDILSFIDADDVMHPRRIEIVEQCFTSSVGPTDVVMLLHNYEMNLAEPWVTEDPVFEYGRLYRCPWGSTQHHDRRGNIVHNSQSSILRHVFDIIQFREEPEFHAKEDTIFCTDVISQFPEKIAYCFLKLSKYSPQGTMDLLK